MIEIKINIEAPELSASIQGLATALTTLIKQDTQQFTPQFTTSAPAPTAPATPAQPMTSIPAASTAPTAPATAVPTTAQTYTMEQLAVAATQLVDAGKREDLIQLLQQYGVQALTALPKELYGAFATSLRQMGVKI